MKCPSCNSTSLKNGTTIANGRIYTCTTCGNTFVGEK